MTSFSLSSYGAFLCASAFYMYQFILRVSPSVMISDMMSSFSVDAMGIASLSSMSLYAYSVMQIPAGILADVWGPRRLIIVSIGFCILGSLLVAATHHFSHALLGRIFIGIGSASAFLCVAKVALKEFGRKHQALFFGFTMMAGTLGALNGGNTVAYLLEKISWRETLVLLSVIGFIVALLNFYGLKEKNSVFSDISQKKKRLKKDVSEGMKALVSVFRSKQCWISALVALGIYSVLSVFADLWGVPFCMSVYHLPKIKVTQLTSFLYVGLCLGSVSIPFLSQKIKSQKPLLIGCIGGILLNLFLLLGLSGSSLLLKMILFFSIGFFAGAEMLCFAHACASVSRENSGTVTGFINGMVMMGGATLQYLFGFILDGGKVQADGHALPLYTEQAYYMAFLLVLGAVFISFLAAFFLTPTPLNSSSTFTLKGETDV